MTQEQKQLLLIDLCARLPYGVKVRISSESDCCLYVNTTTLDIDNLHKYMLDGGYYKRGLFYKTPGFQLLPYLRPMSSMTEGEILEFIRIGDSILRIGEKKLICTLSLKQMDWLNAHHFDYRGLIEKGLALEAKEGMYKTE